MFFSKTKTTPPRSEEKSDLFTFDEGKKSKLTKILPLILLTLIALSLCVPVEEIDFFWHLATGNWILEMGKLPSVDPFSYMAATPDSRDLLVLKGYWLSQILYASLWKLFGASGLVALRLITLGGLLTVVYASIKRWGVNPWFSFLAISPILLDLRLPLVIGIRPQLWSFLFAALFIYILDKAQKNNSRNTSLILIFSTILWSNLHPGVLLGCIIVAIYLLCDLIRTIAGKGKHLWFILVPVLLSSLLNPAGYQLYTPLLRILIPNQEMATYLASNLDGTSFLELWRNGNFESWGFLLALTLSAFTLLFKFKKIRAEHLIILIILAAMSFSSARHMIFLTIIGIQVSVPYWKNNLARINPRLFIKKQAHIITASVLIICASAIFYQQGSALYSGSLEETLYPKGAVKYLKATHPSGNLFNLYEWGGYLMVFLPEYKTYIDGRGLGANSGAMTEYLLVRGGMAISVEGKPYWKNILDQRKIGVVLTLRDDPDGFNYLNATLRSDPEWTLAYQDYISLVFIRKEI